LAFNVHIREVSLQKGCCNKRFLVEAGAEGELVFTFPFPFNPPKPVADGRLSSSSLLLNFFS